MITFGPEVPFADRVTFAAATRWMDDSREDFRYYRIRIKP